MKPIIRRAVSGDIEGIYLLSCKVHLVSYGTFIPKSQRKEFMEDFSLSEKARRRRFEYFLPKLNDPAWYIWVTELDNKIVGYTKETRTGEHTISKRGLFVDPDYQGRGIGNELFKASLAVAKPGDTLYLSVIENNLKAQRLYEKYGFRVSGYAEGNFYGAKLVRMRRTMD